MILGGLYLTYKQPGAKLLTLLVAFTEIFGTIGFVSGLFLGCPTTPFAPLLHKNTDHLGDQSLCGANCACSLSKIQPICGPDNYTNYLSPCLAGCRPESFIQASNGSSNQYSTCDCIEGTATQAICPTNCGNNFETYVLLLGLGALVGQTAYAGNVIISFRIIDSVDKSLAVGIGGAFYSLFAYIPYPLVCGWVTNSACEVWSSKCGKPGNCLVYDSDKLRTRLHGLTLGLCFMGTMFDIIVVFLSSRIKNLYKDDIKESGHENSK